MTMHLRWNKGVHRILKADKNVQGENDKIVNMVIQSLDRNKAEDIVSIELPEAAAIADYMVVASGTSQRHLSALAGYLVKELKQLGQKPRVEGSGDWTLIDTGDVIVHLFHPQLRAHYNLEQMWNISPSES